MSSLAPCAAMAGIQMAWALQTAWTTPLFVEQYGIGLRSIGGIRIAGPIAGMVVQPLAGALADRAVDLRALLALGVSLMVCAMLLLPNASSLYPRRTALPVSIASLWGLDIGMNIAMLVMRAIVAAHFAADEQTHGQALMTSAAAAGQLTGFLLSSLSLSSLTGAFAADRDVGALFAIGAALLVCSAGLTIACARPRQPSAPPRAVLQAFAFWSLPGWLRGVCAVNFCSWLCWFAHVLLLAHWVGEDVFGGEPADPLRAHAYTAGIRFAAGCSALQAATAAAVGAGALQRVVKARGVRFAYAASLWLLAALSCGTCGISALRAHSPLAAKALTAATIGLLGVSWCACNTLPFAIIGERAARAEVGLMLGKLNMYVVSAQVCVSLLLPAASALPEEARTCGPLFAGGLCALGSACLVPLVEETEPRCGAPGPQLAQPLVDGVQSSGALSTPQLLDVAGADDIAAPLRVRRNSDSDDQQL